MYASFLAPQKLQKRRRDSEQRESSMQKRKLLRYYLLLYPLLLYFVPKVSLKRFSKLSSTILFLGVCEVAAAPGGYECTARQGYLS